MFFTISKLLVYFLFPLTWIMVLFIGYFLAKSPRRKRNFLIAILVIYLVFSNSWLLNQFVRTWEPAPVELVTGREYSCAIVLGGFVNADKNDKGYFNLSADRFLQAVMLYKKGNATHILISGGNGNLLSQAFREGKWAEKQLLDMGVPPSAILIENDSRNTLENALYSKRVLDSAGLKPPYLLVTSAFHMPRSEWIFRKQGMDIIPYPCNYFAGRGKFNPMDILPQSSAMSMWFIYIKEVIGFYVYKAKVSFNT